jgi:hypothetical protein
MTVSFDVVKDGDCGYDVSRQSSKRKIAIQAIRNGIYAHSHIHTNTHSYKHIYTHIPTCIKTSIQAHMYIHAHARI